MIYLVLDAFIETEKNPFIKIMIAELILFAIVITFLILSCVLNPLFIIGFGVTLLILFIVLIRHNNKRRKIVNKRFENYNNILNALAEILQNLRFVNKENNQDKIEEDWYSAERIKYLIAMCDNLIRVKEKGKSKGSVFLKPAIIAIMGFGAGIFAEKATLEVNIVIALCALVIVIFISCFFEIADIINDFFIKSNSSEEILNLKSALMDLLLRDFPESANIELEMCSNE